MKTRIAIALVPGIIACFAIGYFTYASVKAERENLSVCAGSRSTSKTSEKPDFNTARLDLAAESLDFVQVDDFELPFEYFHSFLSETQAVFTTGGEAYWFELLNDEAINEYESNEKQYVMSAMFDLSDEVLVLLGYSTGYKPRDEQAFQLRNASTDTLIAEFRLEELGRYDFVREMVLSPNGKCLFVVSGYHIHILETSTYKTLAIIDPEHTIYDFALSANGDHFVYGTAGDPNDEYSVDKVVAALRPLAAIGHETLFEGHGLTVSHVAFSSDGRQIISSSFDGSLRVWDVALKTQTSIFQAEARIVDFDLRDPYVVFADSEDQIHLYHLGTHETLLTASVPDAVEQIAFMDDERIAMIGQTHVSIYELVEKAAK